MKIEADLVIESIKDELNRALWFAVIADESKDISKTEQISIVIRYYLNGTIYERFLGFRPVKELDARSLFNYIVERIQKCSVDLKKCVGQSYDGASVMSGHLGGVQKLFKDAVPEALYVHCFNHRLNLVSVDACKNEQNGREFFGMLQSLYVFMCGSAIHAMFIDLQKLVNPDAKTVELKRICYTRWAAQISACVAVKKLLPMILLFLNKLCEGQA